MEIIIFLLVLILVLTVGIIVFLILIAAGLVRLHEKLDRKAKESPSNRRQYE